ncbi:hypothetical protein [Euzebya sp.]|uniref:hypothetical protein n=1 Tax=Euzebya sp. TaxID=1971409 RepID=UPI0035168346
MHKNHLIGCGVGIAIALAVVALSGGAAGSIGVLAAVLICPIVMGGALWWLARPDATTRPEPARPARPRTDTDTADTLERLR